MRNDEEPPEDNRHQMIVIINQIMQNLLDLINEVFRFKPSVKPPEDKDDMEDDYGRT